MGVACALALLTGCDSLFKNRDTDPPAATIAPPALPGKAGAHRVSQFVFYSDSSLKPNAPLFDELSRLRDQIFRDLRLPPSNTIVQVYLFDDQDKYDHYMRFRYPELPKRRAFFVAHPGTPGGPRELLVFTFWGDHVRQDLQGRFADAVAEEVRHALLHDPFYADKDPKVFGRAVVGAVNDAVAYFLTHPGADAESLAESLCGIFATLAAASE